MRIAAVVPNFSSTTLRDALGFKGGTGTLGAAKILVRAGTAALLDAAHPDIDFPRTEAEILNSVNSALASGNRAQMLALAAQLDADINGVCPLH